MGNAMGHGEDGEYYKTVVQLPLDQIPRPITVRTKNHRSRSGFSSPFTGRI